MKRSRILLLSLAVVIGHGSSLHAASSNVSSHGKGSDFVFVAVMGSLILLGAWLGRCHGSSGKG